MAKALNFASKEKYRKFLAYGHMHKAFHGCKPVTITGMACSQGEHDCQATIGLPAKAHKVVHAEGRCKR